MGSSYIDLYREYTKESEAPAFYHLWSSLSSLAAFIGRDCWIEHGYFPVYPNLYLMLIGSPGTRKSTAIKLSKKIIVEAGYENIAAEKTSKEKFLFDLAAQNDHSLLDEGDGRKGRNGVDVLEMNLWGDDDWATKPPANTYIAADEFNDFIGSGNMEFISLLGNLWDFNGVFKHRVKNGKSIAIPNPTINLFGGNTPTGFATCFPPETLGQGFLSRLLLIYGEPTGVKITFPKPPSPSATATLIDYLVRIKTTVVGQLIMDSEAETLLDQIYKQFSPIDDPRFSSYSNRRFTHLLKLCILCAASRISKVIQREDVLFANTILAHTESMMPKALGEFGKGKHSDVVHTIVQILEDANRPLSVKEIFGAVFQDVDNPMQVSTMLQNLELAGKAQRVGGSWLPKKQVATNIDSTMVQWDMLTQQERNNYE